ncbi:MAG: hypothetical protein ACRD22_11875 [Terriglobia bacterium]
MICQKRKAKRFCPAKSAMICAICCGSEREVTIDCPPDCSYLIASRGHYEDRHAPSSDKMPFAERRIPRAVLVAHEELFLKLSYVICDGAQENPALVDSDVIAAMQALAETYETLTKGILYENLPDHRAQRELYDALKKAVEEYKNREGQGLAAVTSVRDPEIRDALIVLTQTSAARSNGRPKGRALIDLMRSQFKRGTFSRAASSLIVSP